MGKLLEVKNLTKRYYEGTAENLVVDHVNMEVDSGEFVVIMGASGSGKTSLLHLIAGIDDFDEGTVRFSNLKNTDDARKERAVDFGRMKEKEKSVFRRSDMGIVFQQQCLIPDLTVYENIMLPMMLVRSDAVSGRFLPRQSRKDRIFGLCARFGLQEHVNKYPSQLSGGQQQRAAILRSVVNRPSLLLCDEPTGNLNQAQTQLVMELLNELNQNGQTILLVTHDTKVAARGSRIIYIQDGRMEGELSFAGQGILEREARDKEQVLMDFLKERGW